MSTRLDYGELAANAAANGFDSPADEAISRRQHKNDRDAQRADEEMDEEENE
jgi:hypothetical protein